MKKPVPLDLKDIEAFFELFEWMKNYIIHNQNSKDIKTQTRVQKARKILDDAHRILSYVTMVEKK